MNGSDDARSDVTALDFLPCVDAFTGQPFVTMELTFADDSVRRAAQLTPDEARYYALGVLMAAEAAKHDAAMAAWLRTRMELAAEEAARAVAELRDFRRAQAAQQ